MNKYLRPERSDERSARNEVEGVFMIRLLRLQSPNGSLRSARNLSYNLTMPRVLYTAFDIVPSPKGASTHILHNIRGLVNRNYGVHLITPNDGLLPSEDTIEGAQVTRITQDLTQNFLARATHFGKAVNSHIALSVV